MIEKVALQASAGGYTIIIEAKSEYIVMDGIREYAVRVMGLNSNTVIGEYEASDRGGNLICTSNDIKLERKPYIVEVCKKRGMSYAGEWIRYSKPVFAGQRYSVNCMVRNKVVQNNHGIELSVDSPEYAIGNKEIFYMIKEKPELEGIRYWLPMNNKTYERFFIKNADSSNLILCARYEQLIELKCIK